MLDVVPTREKMGPAVAAELEAAVEVGAQMVLAAVADADFDLAELVEARMGCQSDQRMEVKDKREKRFIMVSRREGREEKRLTDLAVFLPARSPVAVQYCYLLPFSDSRAGPKLD